jgi:hypothetical protein
MPGALACCHEVRRKPGARLVVVIRPGRSGHRLDAILRWLRALAPAAALVVAEPGIDRAGDDDPATVLTVDADDLASGPLAVADALARARGRS